MAFLSGQRRYTVAGADRRPALVRHASGSPVTVRWPDGRVRGAIRNFPANRNCARKDPRASYLQLAQVGAKARPQPFGVLADAGGDQLAHDATPASSS